MFIHPFRTFDEARYSHSSYTLSWTALLLLSKAKVQKTVINSQSTWPPGACFEHVTKASQAHVSNTRATRADRAEKRLRMPLIRAGKPGNIN